MQQSQLSMKCFSIYLSIYLLGIPLPLPLSARCAAPGGNPRCGPCGCSDCSFSICKTPLAKSSFSPPGLSRASNNQAQGIDIAKNILIVSSTLKIKQLASTAAMTAFTFTKLGSHTNAAMLSLTPSLSKSTPAQTFPLRCSTRSWVSMLVASKPALSQSWRGMISRALAKDLMIACCLRGTERSACLWRWADTSICKNLVVSKHNIGPLSRSMGEDWSLRFTSHAPPPATMFLFTIARLTIMMASCRLRSTSAMNCSAPPLSTSVQVFAAGHPSKKLNRSPPICRSSNRAQVPRCWGWMSEHVDEMLPPVACTTRSRSSEETRPAQKTSRSAKYLHSL